MNFILSVPASPHPDSNVKRACVREAYYQRERQGFFFLLQFLHLKLNLAHLTIQPLTVENICLERPYWHSEVMLKDSAFIFSEER